MELLDKLGVDSNLLIAQVVNFTILLSVLTYFIYRPLLNLLDARRERIQKAMDEAAKVEHQAQEMENIRQQELAKIDSECGVYMERIRKQAEKVEQEILSRAKGEAEAMMEGTRKQIASEREQLFQEVLQRAVSIVVRSAEKVIQREFADSDEKRIRTSVERDLPTLLQ